MKNFGIASIVVIAITLVLFASSLFFTGFTHDLLLEAGVFLVSVKLIMMAYETSVSSRNIHRELEEIKKPSKKYQGKHIIGWPGVFILQPLHHSANRSTPKEVPMCEQRVVH